MTVLAETLKAVDQEWRDVSDIHARIDCWASPTIRYYLLDMVSSGEVEMRKVPGRGGTKYQFRLPQ